jgi:hypothetical protein
VRVATGAAALGLAGRDLLREGVNRHPRHHCDSTPGSPTRGGATRRPRATGSVALVARRAVARRASRRRRRAIRRATAATISAPAGPIRGRDACRRLVPSSLRVRDLTPLPAGPIRGRDARVVRATRRCRRVVPSSSARARDDLAPRSCAPLSPHRRRSSRRRRRARRRTRASPAARTRSGGRSSCLEMRRHVRIGRRNHPSQKQQPHTWTSRWGLEETRRFYAALRQVFRGLYHRRCDRRRNHGTDEASNPRESMPPSTKQERTVAFLGLQKRNASGRDDVAHQDVRASPLRSNRRAPRCAASAAPTSR